MRWQLLLLCALAVALLGASRGSTAEATPAVLNPPFATGDTWYICQGYNGSISHAGQPWLDLSPDPNSPGPNACTPGTAHAATGRQVLAPAAGTAVDLGGEFICMQFDAGGSMVIGHVENKAPGVVGAGGLIATVKAPGPGNGQYAHLHLAFHATSNCTGSAVAFSDANGARFCGNVDMPYTGVVNEYGGPNGVALTHAAACDTGQPVGNGDMMRADGHEEVWYIQDGNRYHVPTSTVVECLGGWEEVQIVSPATVDSFPDGGRQARCNGRMIRAEGQAPVYYLQDGRRHHVPTASVVECLGGWEEVHAVNEATLSSYPDSGRQARCNGRMIRAEGQTRVYYLQDGRRHHVPAASVVECLGGWEEVHTVSSATVQSFAEGGRQARCNGRMIRAEGQAPVYYIQDGRRHHVPGPTVVQCLGGWEEVHTVSTETVQSFTDGGRRAQCDGRMMRAEGRIGVFHLRGGIRHHVPTPTVVHCLGGWEEVHTVSLPTLNGYPEAESGADCQGVLIRVEGESTTWLLENGRRHRVRSPAVIACHGGWGLVHSVTAATRDAYPRGPTAACP